MAYRQDSQRTDISQTEQNWEGFNYNECASITTLEIAEMIGMKHKEVLRKLDGQEKERKQIKGYIEILNEHSIVMADYFIPSSYKDAKGESSKCYKVTRLGCDFLANWMRAKLLISIFLLIAYIMIQKYREQFCYLVTKKGYEFIAHKLTGEKRVGENHTFK